MTPSGCTRQPCTGWASAVTAPSTRPERSHSAVWSWSSTTTSTRAPVCWPDCTRAGTSQVARLSALAAMLIGASGVSGGAGPGERGQQLPFQDLQLQGVLVHLPAARGGPARDPTHHQHRAQALLQQLDPLRHRRRRHMQHAGRAIEAALAQHRQQGGQLARFHLHKIF